MEAVFFSVAARQASERLATPGTVKRQVFEFGAATSSKRMTMLCVGLYLQQWPILVKRLDTSVELMMGLVFIGYRTRDESTPNIVARFDEVAVPMFVARPPHLLPPGDPTGVFRVTGSVAVARVAVAGCCLLHVVMCFY
uniref:Protein kinase domain-containing protein n=1 Tax=Mesocestoides corti TaxID=53468 RepID=A0A5K3FHW3_MESCO